jgi:hypothetical protein
LSLPSLLLFSTVFPSLLAKTVLNSALLLKLDLYFDLGLFASTHKSLRTQSLLLKDRLVVQIVQLGATGDHFASVVRDEADARIAAQIQTGHLVHSCEERYYFGVRVDLVVS